VPQMVVWGVFEIETNIISKFKSKGLMDSVLIL
jgi:hypothetical protein